MNSPTTLGLFRRQLDRGFRTLRFTPTLELAFIDDHQRRRLAFTRTGMLLAAAFYTAFVIVNVTFGDGGVWSPIAIFRGSAILGVLLMMHIISIVPQGWRDGLIISCYGIFSLILTGIDINVAKSGGMQHYEGMIFAIFHCCLFSGLLLRSCLAVIVAMVTIYVGLSAFLELPRERLGFQALFLILAAMMGVVGVYLTEHRERDNFLRRQMMSIGANFDELTGLASRAAFDRYLRQYLRQAALRNSELEALILVDIDHFKQLNDSRGHDTGDKCLRLIADMLGSTINGDAEAVARWGGDELIAVTSVDSVVQLEAELNDLRAQINNLHMSNPGAPRGILTVSIGALLIQPEQRLEEKLLFRQTDAALYAAKEGGRDQVVIRHAEASWNIQTLPGQRSA